MQLISLIYGFLGFPLVTQIVIQSEAKDLKSISMCIQILPPFGRLNDNMVEVLLFNTPPSPSQEGRYYLPHYLSSRAKRRI